MFQEETQICIITKKHGINLSELKGTCTHNNRVPQKQMMKKENDKNA